jgi:hypothetical protein
MTYKLLLAAVTLMSVALLTPRLVAQSLRLRWQHFLGEDKTEYHYNDMVFIGSEARAWLIASAERLLDNGKWYQPVLFQVDLNGNTVQEIPLSDRGKPMLGGGRRHARLGIQENRQLLMLADLRYGRSFVQLASTGQVLSIQSLHFLERWFRVASVTELSGKRLAFAGAQDEDAAVAVIDNQARVVWERKLDRGKAESFHQILPLIDGVLLSSAIRGRGWLVLQLFGLPSSIRLARCSLKPSSLAGIPAPHS